MNISYDYYRVFYYVAKYKNFTQASRVLLSNQPNLTRTIKLLENSLGCNLFVRSNRGVTLTPEGERLYAHMKIAFDHIESAEEEISLNKSLQSGIISIGASEIALRCLLLPVLKKYKTLYPGVRIHITNHSTPEAISALENGAVDLAVVTTPTIKSNLFSETADLSELVQNDKHKSELDKFFKSKGLSFKLLEKKKDKNPIDELREFFGDKLIVQ